MHVGLFIPCYVDQFYPNVGMATVRVLEQHGVEMTFPDDQTCCGQPMANAGCVEDARPLARKFFDLFNDFDYVVCPSGSCVAMVRSHYDEFFENEPAFDGLKSKTHELCEFLTDVLNVKQVGGRFPHKVGLHQSCHGLRELRIGSSSERVEPDFNKPRSLLETLEGITLSELSRPDECCGFGGMFSVGEEAVSCMMGVDRIDDHEQAGTEILTSVDMSCLMHLSGLITRQGKSIRVMHIAEIFAEALAV